MVNIEKQPEPSSILKGTAALKHYNFKIKLLGSGFQLQPHNINDKNKSRKGKKRRE